jgi:hypothetical protein
VPLCVWQLSIESRPPNDMIMKVYETIGTDPPSLPTLSTLHSVFELEQKVGPARWALLSAWSEVISASSIATCEMLGTGNLVHLTNSFPSDSIAATVPGTDGKLMRASASLISHALC